MKQELKSGIPEFDNAVEQFENGEINFLELTCRLWNTAYAMGKGEQLNLPHVSNNEVAVCDHPDEALIMDKPTEFCLACGCNIPKQTDC